MVFGVVNVVALKNDIRITFDVLVFYHFKPTMFVCIIDCNWYLQKIHTDI